MIVSSCSGLVEGFLCASGNGSEVVPVLQEQPVCDRGVAAVETARAMDLELVVALLALQLEQYAHVRRGFAAVGVGEFEAGELVARLSGALEVDADERHGVHRLRVET